MKTLIKICIFAVISSPAFATTDDGQPDNCYYEVTKRFVDDQLVETTKVLVCDIEPQKESFKLGDFVKGNVSKDTGILGVLFQLAK